MDSFGPHNETHELRVLIPCSCRKHTVNHGDSQKVPFGGMSPNLDGCPQQKSWQFGVIIVTFGILNFVFSRLLLEEFLTRDEIVPQIAIAIGVLTSNRGGGRRTTFAHWTWHQNAIAGCSGRGAIAGCHCRVPL